MKTHPPDYEVQAWHHGALSESEGLKMSNHVHSCEHCSAVLSECQELDDLFLQAREPVVPVDLNQHIMIAIAAQGETQALSTPNTAVVRPVLLALAAASLAFLIMMVPILSVGLQSLLLSSALALKEGLFLARELAPVFKAMVTLLQHVYVPLLVLAVISAVLPFFIAKRALGLGSFGLRNA